jgi:hypothetical protein
MKMKKVVPRLKALFSGFRTPRDRNEAFLIMAKTTPRKISEGVYSFRRDEFTLRLLITQGTSVRVYGSAPSAAEFLWFEGRLADLPDPIVRKIRPLLLKRPKNPSPSTMRSNGDTESSNRSSFPATPWFKEKREAEARARFLGHAAQNRKIRRGSGNDEVRTGFGLGHSTDLD